MVEKLLKSQHNRLITKLDQKVVFFENSSITSHIYAKLKAAHSAIIILISVTILCSFSIFDLSYLPDEEDLDEILLSKRKERKDLLLIFSSVSTFSLIFLEIMTKKNELLYQQYCGKDLKETAFFSVENIKSVLTNIFFYSMHPNYLVEHYPIFNEKNTISFSYSEENNSD